MGAEGEQSAGTGLARGITGHERELLRELLRRFNAQPGARDQIVAEIERRFRRPLAVLALDSSGFSRSVRAGGIIHFLALLERLGEVVRPLVARSGGRMLYSEADNLFAVFPSAASALRCAEAILDDLDAANAPLPESDQIFVAMGIGFGELLVVDDATPFGDEMNLACKLGEDLARRGEVLLTPGAYDALATESANFERVSFSISGLELEAYRLVR
jgi:class 3 adenylate cyclase